MSFTAFLRAGRRFAILGFAGCFALAFASTASAQSTYPNRPITIVVPFSPGGGTDAMARAVGARLQAQMHTPVVVDNRPGAGGTIGAAFAASSAPDGYTLLILNLVPHTSSKGLYKNLPFDPVKSFSALGLVGDTPYVVAVNPNVKAKTLQEFVALAKEEPNSLNYGSSGVGGVSHLSTELFLSSADIQLTHVPYKGDGPVVTDLIGGQIDVTFGNVLALLPHIRAGKLRALAVTGDARSSTMPDVPTVKESGYPDYVVVGQFGFAVPAGTPDAVIERLNHELVQAVKSPEIEETFSQQGVTSRSSTPAEMQEMMVGEQKKWMKIVKDVGIEPN
ncbi:tripartite tricarboxylate transporter substrate binding protein [Pusillimonas sp. SM2304]|uniref:Bug family tripartite tricarboxylate transporter substrate binding protein n=1 Tax=Pusillimonas sp. SM2304 TaxID=3073241 RepID=UPI0028766B64|nr:tripartite tricarboxylate transporter substrate binding protein [Pusillimonas sp. SM2304]MDS1141848.1 tripartite tricarboxylate transporter substrate binding protein [Pusillimonas sp. SM2304]